MYRPETKMVIGLGNPGKEYIDTRHNAGFKVVDSLAEALAIDVKKKKFGACVGQGEFANKKLIFLKPMRFMNCSGQVVATAAGFYKLGLSDLLVVSDDMDLEPGMIRIRARGSAGGHNGLADVVGRLGSEDVNRLRIGIGPCGEEDAVEYVLDKPTKEQKTLLDGAIEKAREAALCWIEYGIEKAMNNFNRT
ncbi:MAG: aminoacyl-tRNA hydrolase [Planctomycetota bacterium]|jgi:PTH1 family peptidyl-tRNA hydrolase